MDKKVSQFPTRMGGIDADLAAACGIAVDTAQVQGAPVTVSQTVTPVTPVTRFVEVSHFLQRPPSTLWLIREFICRDNTIVFFGEPSSGKSLVLIDVACHIATGRDWCGRKTSQGLVLYICGEGQSGLAKRFMAWFQRYNEAPRNIHLATIPAALTDPADITALIANQ